VDLQENGDCGLLPTKAPSSETDRAAELRGVVKKNIPSCVESKYGESVMKMAGREG
jgi:hypothetical protein